MAGFTHETPGGGSPEWYTPPSIFAMLELGFDLDPCHPEGDRLPWIPVNRVFTKADDGLKQPWSGRVWLNPPYGVPEHPCKPKCTKKRCQKRGWCTPVYIPGTIDWLAQMHEEERRGVSLLFARTDTDWFHKYVRPADGVLFLRDRVQFVGRDGKPPTNPATGKTQDSPGTGSMLVAWGKEEREALRNADRFGGHGAFASFR